MRCCCGSNQCLNCGLELHKQKNQILSVATVEQLSQAALSQIQIGWMWVLINIVIDALIY